MNSQQKAEFDAMYKTARDATDDGRLVQLKDSMLAVLISANDAKEVYIPPKCVVPHPANRGGSKMSYTKVWTKGIKIIKVGVSLSACGPDRAVCFDTDPEHKMGQDHVALCKTSPHWASYTDAENCEVGSVGCGHWNQFLACIADGTLVPTQYMNDAKIVESGQTNLDPQRLARDQPVLDDLLTRGLKWTKIKHTIQKAYPELPSIFQKALNVEHHIGEGLRLFSLFVLHQSPSWGRTEEYLRETPARP